VAPAHAAGAASVSEHRGGQHHDPYLSIVHARVLAAAWGSAFFDVGGRGHINASSGLGEWPEGLVLLRRLIDGVSPEAAGSPGTPRREAKS
jgi:hypothetical protein